MNKLAFALLLGVGITGCSTETVRVSDARLVDGSHLYAYQPVSADFSSTIVVTRDSGLIASGCRLGFYINGAVAADLDTGQKAEFHVQPGSYTLGTGQAKDAHGLCTWGTGIKERDTEIAAGQTKAFRMFIDQDGNRDILSLSLQ